MADGTLDYAAGDGIARITLNQPAKFNAMTLGMWQGLPGLIDQAVNDPATRVIAVRGAGGRAFCAGADISQFGAVRTGGEAVAAYDQAVSAAGRALAAAAKPTVALIQGVCFGGGMALAMCCDLRLAAEGSRFRIPAGRLGLGYGFDSIRELVRRLGPGAVAEILFTARIVQDKEALALGIIQRLFPPERFDAETDAYLGTIAENAPLTLRAIKGALVELARAEAEQDEARVQALVAACFASADYVEGQAAFREKRVPRFMGR